MSFLERKLGQEGKGRNGKSGHFRTFIGYLDVCSRTCTYVCSASENGSNYPGKIDKKQELKGREVRHEHSHGLTSIFD